MTSTACVVVIMAFIIGDRLASAAVSLDRAESSVTALRARERNESGNNGECSARHRTVAKCVPFRKSWGTCGFASMAEIAWARRPILCEVLDGGVDNKCGSLYAPAVDSSGHQQM